MHSVSTIMAIGIQLVIWAVLCGGLAYVILLLRGLHKAFRVLNETLDVAKGMSETQAETNRVLTQVLAELRAGQPHTGNS